MKKLLQWLDDSILKFGVSFAIVFIALYPKLPSVHIIRTWVYIRLEDFLIAALVLLWFVQLFRKKVKLPLPVGIPLIVYWISGLLTLVYSLLFIGPHLANFFPHVAALEYLRRIEYMVLFFIAWTTVQKLSDVKNYFITLCLTLVGIVIYGFGQRYYVDFWTAFPQFFTKHPFCFPSYQTGNEEFAKGLPLCLPKEARITSTFGGHYDLGAYLVIVLPLVVAVFLWIKKLWLKISLGLLFLLSLILLNFTASRVSFFAYLLGSIATLIFLKRKKWIFPLLLISTIVLLSFNGATAKRLFETFRIVNVVTNSQGQVVGVAENNLPANLQKKISKDQSVIVEAPPPTQNLPTGSSFITLPQVAVATHTAVVSNQLASKEALKLKLANGGLEISTISGTFLIKKALVYDISFTTRFQSEWPNAWAAFMKNPPLGQGYSTITLASDNDYLRLLGESGFMGFVTFLGIFIILGIFLSSTISASDSFTKAFSFGLAGGVIGLFLNAGLIDVFESSKVAETLWILLGIGASALALTYHGSIAYKENLKKILFSPIFLFSYLVVGALILFSQGLSHFFVADDFTWLKWAAATLPHDLTQNFMNAQGFFYRPLDKTLVFFLYNFFAFSPQGYHSVSLFLHIAISLGVYLLGLYVVRKKMWAFFAAFLFMISPQNSEVLFWFSTISIPLSSLFLIFSVLTYVVSRDKTSKALYLVSLLLGILSLLSYEMAVILPLLIIICEVTLCTKKTQMKKIILLFPFIMLDIIYLWVRSHANVVPLSGDYAYNLSHFLPNVIGNGLGYLGFFFTGENTFLWYQPLRQLLRPFALLMGISVVVVLVGMLSFMYKKHVMQKVLHSSSLLFALSWTIVSLLPFIGLGNISMRYGYFAGIGFAFLVVYFLQMFYERMYNKRIAAVGIIVGSIVFFVWTYGVIGKAANEWNKAGLITEETLATFRYQYPGLEKSSHLYFVNVPIKYGNAWVFPVGLKDGLWFIYRDDSLKIDEVATLKQAQSFKTHNPSQKPAFDYIFTFDKNGEVNQAE